MAGSAVVFSDFYEAWKFLNEHHVFRGGYGIGSFAHCLHIEVARVNPETEEIDEDESKNTETGVRLECGPWIPDSAGECPWGGPSHDVNLDCGAPTFEEAIVKLANLVARYCGRGENGR